MQSVFWVRHGQASFHGPRYDVLSDVGREQARHLGRYLADAERAVEIVFSGPLARQRDTVHAMREGATLAGGALPEPLVVDELAEYPAIALLAQGIPVLVERDLELKGWLGPALDDLSVLGRIPEFDRVFRRVQRAWMTDELALDGIESFAAFRARVASALAKVVDEAGGKRALVVTSGGPIALAVQHALDLSDNKAMRMSEVVANTGLTHMRHTGEEWLLMSFNALPHLTTSALVTYR